MERRRGRDAARGDAAARRRRTRLHRNEVSGYPIAFLLLRWLADAGLLSGYTEGWLRLPFAFVGALAVPLLALFARPRVGRAAASMAAVVLAVHPAHVEACQTASPVVMAITAAVAAAVITRERATVWSWAIVVGAGLLHPIGWLAAAGAVLGASPPGGALERLAKRLPRLVWLLAAAPALRVSVEVLEVVRLPVVVLAAFAFCVRPRIARMLAWMALPLLAFGGVLTLLGSAGRGAAVAAVVPMATLAAAAGCVHAFELLRRSVPWQGRVVALLGAAPAIVVVGEAVTALFLYFVVFSGGRAPWRWWAAASTTCPLTP